MHSLICEVKAVFIYFLKLKVEHLSVPLEHDWLAAHFL